VVRFVGSWQRIENGLWQALAGGPDIYGDDLVRGGVVVDQAPLDLLAEHVLGGAGGKPRDVCVGVVIGVDSVIQDSPLRCRLRGPCLGWEAWMALGSFGFLASQSRFWGGFWLGLDGKLRVCL
jgi:hypothetical protein